MSTTNSVGVKGIGVKIANTVQLRMRAARLLFLVLILENRWLIKGVDTKARVVPLSPTGFVLVCEIDGEVVGTMSIDFYGPGEAPIDVQQEYGLPEFHRLDPQLKVGVISKLAVDERYRGVKLGNSKASVSERLLGLALHLVVRKHVPLCFFDTTPQLSGWYEKIGAHIYWTSTRSRGLGVTVPMVIAPLDIERLVRKGSPLVPMVRSMGLVQNNRGRDLIDRVSPRRPGSESSDVTLRMGTLSPFEAGPFQELPEEIVRVLEDAVTIERFEPGQIVLHPDQANTDFRLVRDGTFEVVDPETGEVFAQAIAGEPQGEQSWGQGLPPGAIVRAGSRPGQMYRIDGEVLWDLLSTDPGASRLFWRGLMRVLGERQSRSNRTVENPDTTWTTRSGSGETPLPEPEVEDYGVGAAADDELPGANDELPSADDDGTDPAAADPAPHDDADAG